MTGEFGSNNESDSQAQSGSLLERVEEVKNAREIMTSAMQNVERTIAGIQPILGETAENLLLRVRAAVHDAASKEVNEA